MGPLLPQESEAWRHFYSAKNLRFVHQRGKKRKKMFDSKLFLVYCKKQKKNFTVTLCASLLLSIFNSGLNSGLSSGLNSDLNSGLNSGLNLFDCKFEYGI